MTDPSNRHMVFTVYDGHVKFSADYPNHPMMPVSGSEPLTWYGLFTGERILEISAQDMIDHLVSVFAPTTSETIDATEHSNG